MNKQKILELLDQLREALSDDDDKPANDDGGKKSKTAQKNPPEFLDTSDDDDTDEDRKRNARRERMGLAPKILPAAIKVGVGTFQFSQHNLAQARAAKAGPR